MRVSVIIKTLNEQRNIERAVRSALAAVEEAGGGEVIVADSLSTDATVEIAARFPVKVVQLQRAQDRCCGVGAQLGYMVAEGRFLYILDGDMEFEPGFLAAACDALERDDGLAGVGGRVREMVQENEEFVNRAQRGHAHMQPGDVDRLDMGGLYRREALIQVGYFTNQNLHAYEEFELAVRLVHAGWRLKRLDRPGIRHYGHTETSFRLLWKRWRSRYAWGIGELIRETWGSPHLRLVIGQLRPLRVYAAALIWCLVSVGLLVAGALLLEPLLSGAGLVLFFVPVVGMSLRRGSLRRGIYAVCAWLVFASGMVAGALVGSRRSPSDPVLFVRVK